VVEVLAASKTWDAAAFRKYVPQTRNSRGMDFIRQLTHTNAGLTLTGKDSLHYTDVGPKRPGEESR
jgi:hypothetical protein